MFRPLFQGGQTQFTISLVSDLWGQPTQARRVPPIILSNISCNRGLLLSLRLSWTNSPGVEKLCWNNSRELTPLPVPICCTQFTVVVLFPTMTVHGRCIDYNNMCSCSKKISQLIHQNLLVRIMWRLCQFHKCRNWRRLDQGSKQIVGIPLKNPHRRKFFLHISIATYLHDIKTILFTSTSTTSRIQNVTRSFANGWSKSTLVSSRPTNAQFSALSFANQCVQRQWGASLLQRSLVYGRPPDTSTDRWSTTTLASEQVVARRYMVKLWCIDRFDIE